MPETRHRLLRPWVLALALLAMATPAGAAAKLVMMNNGKVLRVQSVKADGEWLVVVLDGGHTLGIQAELVANVQDDLGDNNDFGTSLNVVTSGRYVPPSRTAGFSNRRGRVNPNNALTEDDGEEEDSDPRPSQPQPAGVTVPTGQIPGVGVQPGAGVTPPRPVNGLNLPQARRLRANRPANN